MRFKDVFYRSRSSSMKMAKKHYHRANTLIAASLAVASCGVDVKHDSPNDIGKFRCKQDGLCITSDSKKLYSGGYRKNDLEIEFDIGYRPSFITSLNRGSVYCSRMLCGMEHQYKLSDNSNCPKAWYEGPKKLDMSWNERYEEFMREFDEFVQRAEVPAGREEQWKELKHLADSSPLDRKPPTNDPNVGVVEYPGDPVADAGATYVYGQRSGDSLAGVNKIKATEDNNKSQNFSFSLSSSSGESSIVPSTRYEHAGLEFKQEIELWSQPAKSFLLFGWDTRKHHSGSSTSIYYRSLGSDRPWIYYDTVDAGNHGAKPWTEDMTHYATCTDTPITPEYYAVGGECEGGWAIEHLCNDDTAYQIFHAYGGWNGGNHCLGKRRDHRPWCGKPW